MRKARRHLGERAAVADAVVLMQRCARDPQTLLTPSSDSWRLVRCHQEQ